MADTLPRDPALPQAVAAGPPEKTSAPAPAAAPVVGQPVGTVQGQANPPTGDPAQRKLPTLPEVTTLPQESVLIELHKKVAEDIAEAARDNGKNFYAKGEGLRPKCEDSDTKILSTVRSDAEALASVNHPCDLKGRLERGKCDYLLAQINGKIMVSPDNIPADMRAQIQKDGCEGKDYTKTEVRQGAVNVNIMAKPVVRMEKAKKGHKDVLAWHDEEMDVVDEIKESVASKKRNIAELQADVAREERAINNKMTNITAVKQAADGILDKSEELFKICDARARQMIIGANCIGSACSTRNGILKPMGLTPDSHNYKAVKFDKVVDGLVHSAVGNYKVKKLTAFREMMDWADDMPDEMKKQLKAKLAGAGSSGD